jgi:hypothetical protein
MELLIEKDINASTITMITGIKGNVNIVSAYEVLCILCPRNEDGTRFVHPIKTRNKIPYFGIPNAIVCVKYEGTVRGIRQNKGQMNNVVSIDLQCCDKNINLKLAKTKIQLTGANSEKMGIEAFQILCAHLNMIQDNINYKNSLSDEIKQNTMEWISSQTELNMEMLELVPDNVDKRLTKILYSYYSEFDEYEKFLEKIKKVIMVDFLCSENVQPDNPRISNSVYNYTLGKQISLINMTMHLRNKGFNANFHNWNTTYVNVSVPILKEFNGDSANSPESILSGFTESSTDSDLHDLEPLEVSGEEHLIEGSLPEVLPEVLPETLPEVLPETSGEKKEGKIKVHRFIIYRGGSIKQTSPTSYEEALDVRNVILESLIDFKF